MQYALDKRQQVFMKTQLGMSVCLIKILTDTKESLGTVIYSSLAPTGVWASWWRDLGGTVDFERVITMIVIISYLTFLVLLYSSTSRYPHPAIRSTTCEVHPGTGGTF